MFKKAKLNRKGMKSMSSADTDEVPEVRNHKSVPYGAGKEPRLSHGGEVKTKVLVTLKESLETPTLSLELGTSVTWKKPRSKPNLWLRSFQKSKPNISIQRNKSIIGM